MQDMDNISSKVFGNISGSISQVSNDLITHFTSAIGATKGEVKSLNNIFDDLFNSISQGIVSSLTGGMSMQQGLSSMFGSGGGNSGAAAMLGGLSSIFGGSFAKGGTVKPGKAHVVGDGGEPELFVPNSVGSIVPASKIAELGTSQGGIVINMSIQTPDVNSFNYSRSQIAADMARQMHRARRNL